MPKAAALPRTPETIEQVIADHYEGNRSAFGRDVGRKRQTVHYWLTGHHPIPDWVWTLLTAKLGIKFA